jgi:hypothetical protein
MVAENKMQSLFNHQEVESYSVGKKFPVLMVLAGSPLY